MHGISPSPTAPARLAVPLRRVADWLRGHRRFALIVLLPTLLAIGYLYGIASDQYASEAHFVVRTSGSQQPRGASLGAALTAVGISSSTTDAAIVSDYLESNDVVEQLRRRIDLVARYRRPGIDPLSRLWASDPAPETLLRYYLGKIDVRNHSDTGITSVEVRGFSPQDSLTVLSTLLNLAEERVNTMNRRNYQASVSSAMDQVRIAEQDVAEAQSRMTAFRRNQGDFDPGKTGTARVTLVGELQGRLADARATAQSMAAALSPAAPQLVAQRSRVAALERQVAAEQGRIASGPGNVATGLGQYEGLQMRQEFAGKEYATAAAALQGAREDAAKQQLFIVRVVDPSLPVKALYPKRGRVVLTVFFGLLLTYGIGWLIAAGVREHSV